MKTPSFLPDSWLLGSEIYVITFNFGRVNVSDSITGFSRGDLSNKRHLTQRIITPFMDLSTLFSRHQF